jgi:UDP-N-acetylmuramoyl-L-alanyl-D-glutamate--2,6-diaminopimelate ligase
MRVALKIDTNHLIDHLHTLANSSAKVCADSRQIQSGDIFFAYPVGHGNALCDGRQFIKAALENGAAAVVFDPVGMDNQFVDHPQCIAVENLATQAGQLCSQWYDHPSKELNVIGVTGTNGKTSITQWLALPKQKVWQLPVRPHKHRPRDGTLDLDYQLHPYRPKSTKINYRIVLKHQLLL